MVRRYDCAAAEAALLKEDLMARLSIFSVSRPITRLSQLAAGGLFFAVLSFDTHAFAQRASAAASGPFAGMSGDWRGGGAVTLASGDRERIRCRAKYNVGGDGRAVRQTLTCASDSYRFSLNGDMRVRANGEIEGSWSEGSRNAAGSITGVARNGQISGMIQGTGFAAQVSVRTRGDNQQVSLASQGDVRTVSINLRRAR